jgi:hypothetical protein
MKKPDKPAELSPYIALLFYNAYSHEITPMCSWKWILFLYPRSATKNVKEGHV